MSDLTKRGTCLEKLERMSPKRKESIGLVDGTFCGWTKDNVYFIITENNYFRFSSFPFTFLEHYWRGSWKPTFHEVWWIFSSGISSLEAWRCHLVIEILLVQGGIRSGWVSIQDRDERGFVKKDAEKVELEWIENYRNMYLGVRGKLKNILEWKFL